ncbi:hypothetical protein Bbelb_391370 [Branchiostoma belcheri]|nr:hypothetical protein Bbelb_391370 [Branchiostoma belcheri]
MAGDGVDKGFLGGGEDYWTHRKPSQVPEDPFKPSASFNGLDLRDQDEPVRDQNGTYSTHLFAEKAIDLIVKHDPKKAPEEYIKKYQNVKSKSVRTYAAMVTAMDEAIGNVTDALKQNGLWDNTILIFSTVQGTWVLRGLSGDVMDRSDDPPDKRLWLFNIRHDPHERTDLSERHPDIVEDLLRKLAAYNKTAVPPFWPDVDPRSNPALHNDMWGPWL